MAKIDRADVILLQQVLAHDSGMLSIEELEARNPDIDASELHALVDGLVDRGYLTALPAPESHEGLPAEYYAVTKQGIETLKDGTLYAEIRVWNAVYDQVPDSSSLEAIEDAPRPEPPWYDDG